MKHNLKTIKEELRKMDDKPLDECSKKEALTWIFVKVNQMEGELRQLKQNCDRRTVGGEAMAEVIDKILGESE